jgi:ABC-type transport system substrate-binding protein
MATPGSTLIPPINSYWHYNITDAEKFPLNYTLANETLENAGYHWNSAHTIRVATASSLAVINNWVTEGRPLTFDILIRQDYPEEKDIAFYLQREWAKIGIQINLDIVDESTLNTIVYKYLYDLMIWYWSADIDPNYQLFVQTSMAINGWSDNCYTNPAYDQNYTNSVVTLDRAQRRVYVDNAQRVNYQDASYIILAYANQTYAWRTDTFTGWGDWAADPGRSVDNFWMGNPLYFDLMPMNVPAIPEFSTIIVPVLATVALVAALLVVGRGRGWTRP